MRLIPGKTKVRIELFKGVSIGDIVVVSLGVALVLLFAISSLPWNARKIRVSFPFFPATETSTCAKTAAARLKTTAKRNIFFMDEVPPEYDVPDAV